MDSIVRDYRCLTDADRLPAFVVRHQPSDVPIGIESGLAASLFLLLVSIPATSLMMIIDAFAPFM